MKPPEASPQAMVETGRGTRSAELMVMNRKTNVDCERLGEDPLADLMPLGCPALRGQVRQLQLSCLCFVAVSRLGLERDCWKPYVSLAGPS